jgi:hypothetical protein
MVRPEYVKSRATETHSRGSTLNGARRRFT